MLRRRLISAAHIVILLATVATLTACVYDDYSSTGDDESIATRAAVEINIRMQLSTVSAEGYDEGTTWENYLDLRGNDFRIYFFTNDQAVASDNTLLAELEPTSIYASTANNNYVTYTIRGELDSAFATTSNFKVVVAANWSAYPSVTPGTTTMQSLCNASIYYALQDNGTAVMPSSTTHLPYYGVQDYTGVTWELNKMTQLTTGISMVQAVAKIEVMVNDDERTLSNVTLDRYNGVGYCAPLYYDSTSAYDTHELHLVSGGNDSQAKSLAFVKTQERTTDDEGNVIDKETWTAYVPEYDNSGSDYATITATFSDNDEELTVYFGNYYDGVCTAYSSSDVADRFNIARNYCYRFSLYNMSASSSLQAKDNSSTTRSTTTGINSVAVHNH